MKRKQNNYWMLKITDRYDPKFIKDRMNEIKTNRIKNNKDKMQQSYARILLAMMRDDITVKRMSEADFIDKLRGDFQ